jgi:hypothetical protein
MSKHIRANQDVSPDPSTPISESRYTGMTPDETLVFACEGPVEPDDPTEFDATVVYELERPCLASNGMHICRRIGAACTKDTKVTASRRSGARSSTEDPQVEAIHSTEASHGSRTSEDAARSDRIEPWQVTLNVWRAYKGLLRSLWLQSGDPKAEDDLKAWGGMTTDYAHEYRVEQAIKQGRAVPREVLADYPRLAARHRCPDRGSRGR